MARLIYDITARTNPLIVKTAALSATKMRKKQGLYIFEGIKLFIEALNAGLPMEYAVATEDAVKRLSSFLDKTQLPVYVVPEHCFEKVSTEKAPEGIVCVARLPETKKLSEIQDVKRALILCDIQDAGNLGTVIRTVKALSDLDVVLCGSCADVYGYKCIRASMGAVFKQRILLCDDFAAAVRQYGDKGYNVYAAALLDNSLPIGQCDMTKACTVLGNEGHGLPSEITDICTPMIIPMAGMESLNVAAAATVCVWEMTGRGQSL